MAREQRSDTCMCRCHPWNKVSLGHFAPGLKQIADDAFEATFISTVQYHPVGCLCGDCQTTAIREARDPRDERRFE